MLFYLPGSASRKWDNQVLSQWSTALSLLLSESHVEQFNCYNTCFRSLLEWCKRKEFAHIDHDNHAPCLFILHRLCNLSYNCKPFIIAPCGFWWTKWHRIVLVEITRHPCRWVQRYFYTLHSKGQFAVVRLVVLCHFKFQGNGYQFSSPCYVHHSN